VCLGLLEVYPNSADDGCPTVHYLHRTVADYLRTARARSLLSRADAGSDDVNLQLCAVYLSQIKSFATGDLECLFPSWLGFCLDFAKRTKGESRQSMIRILDELDATGKALAKIAASRDDTPSNRYAQFVLSSGNWVFHPNLPRVDTWNVMRKLDRSDLFGRTFLSLVVRRGITGYISARAERGCLVERIGIYEHRNKNIGSIVWPLLMDALAMSKPHLPVVEELLDHGASLDFQIHWPGVIRKTPYEVARSVGGEVWEEVKERRAISGAG